VTTLHRLGGALALLWALGWLGLPRLGWGVPWPVHLLLLGAVVLLAFAVVAWGSCSRRRSPRVGRRP
jgi:hypothetical protein